MTDAIARLNATLADRYRIERQLGAGGMATVYLAHDVRHERMVALKVLHPELAAVIGAERFLAEIKTTAHLHHAHILGLIDSGTVNGTVFYVMPFVEGESLRDRLDREKQLPVADAVRITTAVAGALDYAHRRGVIHRDIKPANILLHEGQALIADFGIALAVTRTGAPVTGARMTETGMSLGTPQYMSPEQAMGERNIDARTDIYSLGCVLYEMLTGEPPFTGPTSQAVITKVMGVDPEPVTTLRRSVPANIAAATMTALSKVPADRFATAAEFVDALGDPQYVAADVAAHRAARASAPVRRRTAGVALVVALLAIAAIAWRVRSTSDTPSAAPLVARFEVVLPASAASAQFVLSADGSRILWATDDGYWQRRLDSLGIRRLRDAAVAQSAIRSISPNGRDVFIGGRGGMAIVPLTQGPARSIAAVGRGGSWDGNDIYFVFAGPPGTPRGIGRIRATDGAVDTVAITGDLGVPSDVIALPGGKGLVAVLNRATDVVIAAFDLVHKRWHPLGISGNAVQFVAPGYLLYTTGQYLMAAPFDVEHFSVTQASAPIAEAPGGSVERFTVGGNVLAYLPAPDRLGVPGIALRSAKGERLLPDVPDSIIFSGFTLSPDGQRFAAVGTPRPAAGASPFAQAVPNIYVFEIASGRRSVWRSELRESNPAWMPGGHELAFVRIGADSPATATLMRRPWDGSGPAVPIYAQPLGAGRGSPFGSPAWLADGRRAVVQVAHGNGAVVGRGARGGAPAQTDLMLLSLDAPDSLRPFVVTDFSEGSPAMSPDGRLLAYASNESGRTEVYVRPVSGGALRQVSVNGGTQPKWAHSGHELFFRNADTLFSARIAADGELAVDRVVPRLAGGNLASGYAVGPGDSSFIMRAAPSGEQPVTVSLIVVMNVRTELQRIFGAAARATR